jgi:hypothetical protein
MKVMLLISQITRSEFRLHSRYTSRSGSVRLSWSYQEFWNLHQGFIQCYSCGLGLLVRVIGYWLGSPTSGNLCPRCRSSWVCYWRSIRKLHYELEYDNGGLFSGLVLAGINGLAKECPEVQEVLNTKVTLRNRKIFEELETQCTVFEPFVKLENLTTDGKNLLEDPLLMYAIRTLTYGSSGISSPIYIYQSRYDKIMPVQSVAVTYEKWCAQGTSITYVQDLMSEHLSGMILGALQHFLGL